MIKSISKTFNSIRLIQRPMPFFFFSQELDNGNKRNKIRRCLNCGSLDHIAPQCKQEQVCYRCKKPGHKGKDCTESVSNPTSRRNANCYNCGQEGHISANCTQQRKPRQPQRDNSNLRCYNCQGMGHISKNCPNKPSDQSRPSRRNRSNSQQFE